MGPAEVRLTIDMCTTIGGGTIDKISEVAIGDNSLKGVTVHNSLFQFLGLAIDTCSTIGGCAID